MTVEYRYVSFFHLYTFLSSGDRKISCKERSVLQHQFLLYEKTAVCQNCRNYIKIERDVKMIRILIQQFVNGKPRFNRQPKLYQEAIEMEVPAVFDLIVIQRITKNTFNIYGVSKDYESEVIEL